MADLTQQYLDILRGYGVDTSQLQYADPAKLKRIVDQTRQAPDTGGGAMAVGQQAAQQAAKDVIGGTTPYKGLEDLLKEAHTGPSITQAASEAVLPMDELPAMSAPRELSIRQHPGGPQPQGDIERPTSLGVKTSTATLRPDKVASEVAAPKMDYDRQVLPDKIAGEVAAPKMDYDRQVLPDKIAGEVPAPEMDYERDIRPDKIAGEVPAPDMTFEDNELDFDPTRGRYQERPILMEETVVTPQPEEVEDKPSFLSRLGGFAKDNPELLAQIAQAGGGLMQDIAQGRAQKAADAKTRGAMAQSNLIGALTGGKSRPAVMREEAEQGGLLARLGQAVEAGGRVAGGEMKRRTALSQRDEEMGLERDKVENAAKRLQVDLSQAEAQKAYQGRMLELQKLGISNDLLIARAKAGKKDAPPQKVYDAYLAAQNVMDTVSTVEELMQDAGVMQAGPGLMALRAVGLEQGLPQFLGGDKTREITASVNKMVQTLGEDMTGILSNQDILFLKAQAPSDEDSLETVIKKADLIRNRIAGSITNRAGIDADYFDMTPFAGLIDSVAAQGEQTPDDLLKKLGQTEIKL